MGEVTSLTETVDGSVGHGLQSGTQRYAGMV
jgi:hypothetical protein